MKTYTFYILLASTLIFNSCGGDDPDPIDMTTECTTSFTCEIDGVSKEFTVISSTVVNVEISSVKEVLIASSVSGTERLDIQILLPIDENICMDLDNYSVSNSSIPISVVYYKGLNLFNPSVADNFLLNRGSGSINFSDCNPTDLFLDAEFSFNCINNDQESVQITNGKMEKLCFATSK